MISSKKVESELPASVRKFPMLSTEFAALFGRVTTKKMRNTIARNPTIFLTFTTTTVHGRYRTLRLSFVPHRPDPRYPARGPIRSIAMTPGDTGVPCVGGIAYDSRGRLLLVRRANEPGRGLWSLPGGRVEPGEDDAAALVREMAEETGLDTVPGPLVGRVRRGVYDIADYRCEAVGGELRAGDDATDARWVDAAELARLPVVDGLREVLAAWDALPGQG
jgi:8-oxo-dGTP diphosphatase